MAPILDVLLPPACAGCGAVGALLCVSCLGRALPASHPGSRFVAPESGVLIGTDLVVAVTAFAFDGPVRRALARLKYERAWRLARPLAHAAASVLRELLELSGPAPLVPVPVHPERRRVRGYNQAELLARELASVTRLGCADLLERVRPTTKQHRLDRAARLANLRGAFGLAESARSVPTTVIVVDDIVTTSATLESCASVLRAAGADEVYGFAVAREI